AEGIGRRLHAGTDAGGTSEDRHLRRHLWKPHTAVSKHVSGIPATAPATARAYTGRRRLRAAARISSARLRALAAWSSRPLARRLRRWRLSASWRWVLPWG